MTEGPQSIAARRSRPSGWWGVALLVASEATLFGTLITSYFYLRFTNANWPPPGVKAPSVALPLAITGALLATSIPMALAARRARDWQVAKVRAWVVLALLVQAGYLAVQIVLFRHDLNDFSPTQTAYGSIYFTLLAVHHAHVAIGLALDLGLLALLTRGLTRYRVTGVQGIALYWHFVNVLGVCVTLTQLSPSL